MKKQFLICSHNLELKSVIMSDESVRIFDCITPQKTEITFPLNYNIDNNDIVIIRDHASTAIEFIGIIDTVKKDTVQTVLIYPIERIFDNECILQDVDGDVYTWIKNSIGDIDDGIAGNFVNTGDALNDYPISVIKEYAGDLNGEVLYKRIVESKNLYDNLADIFINTGVYLKFGIAFDAFGNPSRIVARVYNANEQEAINIRYDNPIIVDSNVSIESSHTGNYNKAIVRVLDEDDELIYTSVIYLRDDNKLTTDPNDSRRISQVKPKLIDYKPSKDEITLQQYGEAIIMLAEKALCGNAFDHSIEFNVVLNDGYKFEVNHRCYFLAEDRIYDTYVTSVEYLDDRRAKIKLGAYRYTITDRFNALRKGEPTLDSIGGVSVPGLFEQEMFYFDKNASGDLVMNYSDTATMPAFEVDANDDLYFVTDDPSSYAGRYIIDEDGNLVYNI